jgi:alcohol dehydrogenase class IV
MPQKLLLSMRKFVAPEFVFGSGGLALAGRQAAGLGVRRALLVADPGLFPFGWPQLVEESLTQAGLSTVLFSGLSSNPRDHEVMDGAAFFLENGCDAIVAVGGGSAMDCAKAIGIVSANKRHVLDFEGVDNVERPGPPLLCVPTTAGTGAEVSQFAIITDTQNQRKAVLASKTLIPDAALIDPDVTVTMPPQLTVHVGLDALSHAVEAYVSSASGPVTDLFALEAVRLIAAALPEVLARPDGIEARGSMLLGSLYAGMAFSNAILGAVHALSHSLGGLLDLPHGLCNAILLDHVIAYNYASAPERFDALARALGAAIDPAAPMDDRRHMTIAAFAAFKRRVGLTQGLADLGIKPADYAGLAKRALDDPCMLTNPRKPTLAELEAIYASASRSDA